jgi:hypothetical protein
MTLQSLLPAFLPLIRKHLPKLEPALITYLALYQPNPSEKGVTVMLDIDGEKAFIAIVGIDAQNTITRVISRERVGQFIEKLIKNVV